VRTGPITVPGDASAEVSALIQLLHDSGQRLEELTAGEVDTVSDRDGKTFVLRRAQEHLRHNEAAKQAAILNALPAHVALLDARGVIVSVNEAWRRFACENAPQGPGASVGTNFLEACDSPPAGDPSQASVAAQGVRSVLSGSAKTFSMDYWCHCASEQCWLRMIVSPLSDESNRGVVVMHLDVTQQKEGEDRLQSSELRFRQLAENLKAVLFLVNVSDGQTLYVSPAFEEIWGRSVEDVYANSRAWSDSIVPEDHARILRERYGSGDSGRFEIDFRIARPDGEVRSIKSHGFPIKDRMGNVARIAGIAEDVTDRVRMQSALRESEAALRRAQELALMAHVVSGPDGTFESWSHTAPGLVGCDAATMPRSARDWLAIVHPEDREKVRAGEIEAAVRLERTEIEYRVLCGEFERYILQVMEPIPGSARADGRMRWFFTLQDTSERKRAEAEMRLLNVELEQRVAERTAELVAANAELEAFDYSIAHDLRAPLIRIEGFSSMLGELYADKLDAQGRDVLDRIRQASSKMDHLVTDLFKLSMTTHGGLHRERVDLTALAGSIAVALHETEPQRDVVFSADNDMIVRADAGLLRIVLENLLGNAWKFTRRCARPVVEFGRADNQGELAFFVRDNGAGFDNSGVDRLFTPFQRLHSPVAFQGTGIGLATVRRIIRRHGGRVWAQSLVDHGATFFFTLPD